MHSKDILLDVEKLAYLKDAMKDSSAKMLSRDFYEQLTVMWKPPIFFESSMINRD